MKKVVLDFSLNPDTPVEFGAWVNEGKNTNAYSIQAKSKVQRALREMLLETIASMEKFEKEPEEFSPTEPNMGTKYIVANAGEYDSRIRKIHEANNLTQNQECLKKPEILIGYFARFTDKENRRLTAVRNATQFKGVVKKKLIRLGLDSLELVKDHIFKLDTDFDLIIDSIRTHILRPGSFVALGKLNASIMSSVSTNVDYVKEELPFVEFDEIEEYAKSHVSAAKSLAAIRKQMLKDIDKQMLKAEFAKNEIGFQENNGKMSPEPGGVTPFLAVLDRRRFVVELIKGHPEKYMAPSRRKIN